MPASLPPEYGGHGDPVAARRRRRAFISGTIAILLFTFALYISDNYLRYSHLEYLLRGALRDENANSARPYLRNAVRTEEPGKEAQLSRYLQALAEREEHDLILPTWERAFQVDNENSALTLRYGAALFAAGSMKEARDRFHDAAVHDEQNALPAYLEAATVPFLDDTRRDLSEALALVARTNNSNKKVSFPKPIWTATLPSGGKVYANARRRAIDDCLAPIYAFVDLVILAAKEDVAKERIQPWRSRVQTLDRMGERLVQSSEPGTLQTICGIRIQLAAIELQKLMNESESAHVDEALVERGVKLRTALDTLNAFEANRDAAIERETSRYAFFNPLWFFTFLIVIGSWGLLFFTWVLVQPRDIFWTLPLPRAGIYVQSVAALTMLLAIGILTRTLKGIDLNGQTLDWFQTGWFALLTGIAIWNVAHALYTYPRPRSAIKPVAAEVAENAAEYIPVTWRTYFEAVATLSRRYAGGWVAMILAVFCCWFLYHRLSFGLFPFYGQNLLTPGMTDLELQVVSEALRLLE